VTAFRDHSLRCQNLFWHPPGATFLAPRRIEGADAQERANHKTYRVREEELTR
jgi:hypothetical protein